MANLNISANNVSNVKFLRNGALYTSAEAAKNALLGFDYTSQQDGTAILARYSGETDQQVTYYRTMVGFVFVSGNAKSVTILDVEGAQADVDALRKEVRAKFGTGVTTDNSATDQFEALSGSTFTPGTSSSADTSVEGAKAYAYDLIGTLDYEDTAVAGQYVSQVTQADGKIAVTRVELPSSADTAVAKKFVTAVAEDKGQIVVSRGEISSTDETIVLTDNADGGVNFEVNIDGASIVQDPTSKKIKVADSALTQYYGDEKTVHAEVDSTNNTKTFSTLLKIVKNANPSETEVKEEYFLADGDGTAITGADTIKIYKDSHIVSITYITDSGDTHYQNLEYKYIDASGATKTEYVDISSLVLEAEFASGLTIENHVARGVVDPTSETFLTVGADGFKLSGVQDAIDAAVADLDATVNNNANSGHVAVEIVETDGKLVSVTVTEDDIASADDIEELSAKTVTNITSTNSSIDIATANTSDGTVEVDVITDADKIKMSGFSAENTSALSGISEGDSIATAFEKTNTVITENERVTAAALTDLNTRVDTISGDVDTIKEEYISGVSVNGNAVTVANKVAPISITAATSAATATSTEAIVVNTDANGNITLGIANIDCGYYDGTQG